MSDVNYVETLELARDGRLHALVRQEPAVARFEALARGGPDAVPPAADGFGGDVRAAVNGASVVSFVAGLDAVGMSDVLYSTQFAQRAASARRDRHAATEDWYRAYVEVLERVGWVAQGFAFAQRRTDRGGFTMDSAALEVIGTIATGNHLAILVKAVDALRKLADEDRAIRILELQAFAELSGSFQPGTVQRDPNGALTLALGAFHFRCHQAGGRFLFWTWGRDEIEFFAAAQTLTLNAGNYATVRAAVAARLAAAAPDYVAELAIV